MSKEQGEQLVIDFPAARPRLKRPCDRCEEREATRFGVAQVVSGERGARWQKVGLCDRCAAYCAAPGGAPGSSLAAEHSISRW